MKFNFKKIASVMSSAVMIGSTVALAAAANFPAPFVKNGAGDVAIVYGNSAATTDLVAVADIQSALSEELAKQTATGGSASGATVSGGDFVKLAKTSDNLNLRDVASTVFGTTVSKDDLSTLLADGIYKNDENTEYKYEQKITLGNVHQINYFSDSDYKDRAPTLGVNMSSTAAILNYTIDFLTDAESDVTSGDLVDLETTDITILGKSYYILDAKNSTLKLTLLDAADSAIIKEGETKSITVGSKTYEVAIDTISGSASSAKVKLIVDGVVTNSLAAGATERLSDGSYVGIKDISIRDVAGVIGSVEFSIGSGKLELTDAQAVELNDDSISGLNAYLTRGTASGDKERLDKIVIEWKNDDKTFVTPDQELTMPGFKAIKESMSAFKMPVEEITTVEHGGTDYMQIKTTIKDGTATIPFLYANGSGEFTGIGKDSNNRLVTASGVNVLFNETQGDQWLVATWNSTTEGESYLLTFSFSTDNGINRTTVKKYVSGASTDVCEDKTIGSTCNLGSLSLTITNITKSGAEKTVNLTAGAGGSFNSLYTKSGLEIRLPYFAANTSTVKGAINVTETANVSNSGAGHSYDSFYLFFNGEDKDDNLGVTSFNVTIDDQSDGDLEVSNYDVARVQISDPDDSNHKMNYLYADTTAKVERMGDSSAQKTVKVTYAGSESFADLFLTAIGASVSSTSATSGTVKTLGKVIYKDTEAVSGKNLIVVGGSCVNKVAATLLGSATPLCGADFTTKTKVAAGQFLIQTFSQTGDKVATLVAGFNAADTTAAATYLTTQSVAIDATQPALVKTSSTVNALV